MNNYFKTYDKKDCIGCGMCALICPKGSITMTEDSEGFLYPVINKEKCVHCNLCVKRCPNNPLENKTDNQKTYIAYCKDKKVKKRSSSGGMFFPIAKYVIEQKGVVFGVTYDASLVAYHEYVTELNDLKRFQGSKYVRSDLKNSYKEVQNFLKKDKYVLFTGTPCQCQGLRAFLKKDYDKLITCEIICHANPSPKIFNLYKKNLETINNKKIKNIYFRSKENGWKKSTPIIRLEDETNFEDATYYKAFIAELINRPSCSACRFCGPKRYSDFSIGDLWGIDKIDSTIEDNDTGISLLNVNTEKGFKILDKIKAELYLKEVDTNLAFSYNHHQNVPIHKNRDKFFKEISNGTINETNIISKMNQYTKSSLTKRVVRKSKAILNQLLNRGCK